MKKIIACLLVAGIFNTSFAQDATSGPDFRKHRFGLHGNTGLTWFQVGKPGKENKSLGLQLSGGLNYEYCFNRTISLATGAYLGMATAGAEYTSDVNLTYTAVDNQGTSSTQTAYQLHSRRYVFNSVDIPVKLRFRTPEIGYLTYVVDLGFNNSILTSTFASKNLVTQNMGDSKAELSDNEKRLEADDESLFFRSGIALGLGAEYNLVGNTSLFMQLNGNIGLTNVLKKESESIDFRASGNSFQRATKLHYIGITIGVQF